MAYQNGKTYYLIPTCATGDAAYNQKILNKQVQPLSLNIRGTGNHYNNRNVNVYSLDWSTDMQWKVMVYDGYARILCAGNTAYGLDYYYGSSNPGNCDIYQISGNDEDSKINFRTINASENLYRIQCYKNNADNNLYLTATGSTNGADVRWQPLDSSKAAQQTWWLVPIENISENTTPTPTIPSTPNEIKDQEFFVKAYGTNLYLNVHGTDTVANTRNVNAYTKENCLAQKWIAKQEAAGPKLFTSINQAFALNIDTADNNCTMYTAYGNDNDSVLYFEEMGDMLYRIKMHNHNKYLHVDTEAESGDNVYWVSDINSGTYWEFIPENVVFPPSISENRKEFLRELQGLLGDVLITDTMVNSTYNIGDDSDKQVLFQNNLLKLEAEAGYRVGLTQISDEEYLKYVSINYDNVTNSAELVVGTENVNISTDFGNLFKNSEKSPSAFLTDIAVTLGTGMYAFKFGYEGPTTATIEIVRNVATLPTEPDREVNATIKFKFYITLYSDFLYEFVSVLAEELSRQFVAKFMFCLLYTSDAADEG